MKLYVVQVMTEYIWFTEEDMFRGGQEEKMFEVENIPLYSFQVPSQRFEHHWHGGKSKNFVGLAY